MKNKILYSILVLLIAISSFLLVSCDLFGTEDDDSGEASSDNGQKITYDFDDPALANEEDGAEPVKAPHKEDDFYGKWSTYSDYAEYIFGNVDLNVKEDGTWTGNITDEKFSGKWKYDGSGLILRDTEGYINWNLYYVQDGTMMFRDLDDPEVDLVLKKK